MGFFIKLAASSLLLHFEAYSLPSTFVFNRKTGREKDEDCFYNSFNKGEI